MTVIRVMLIEDNEDDARIIQNALEPELFDATFELTWYQSKVEALREFKRNPEIPDVLLLDLNLPDSIGFETLVDVINMTPESAVVAVTSQDRKELARAAILIGAADYLVKGPTVMDILPRVVYHATLRHRVRRELENTILTDRLTKLSSQLLFFEQLKYALLTTAVHGGVVRLLHIRILPVDSEFLNSISLDERSDFEKVLLNSAVRVQDSLSPLDLAGFSPPSDFLVLLVGDSDKDVARAARRILLRLKTPSAIPADSGSGLLEKSVRFYLGSTGLYGNRIATHRIEQQANEMLYRAHFAMNVSGRTSQHPHIFAEDLPELASK